MLRRIFLTCLICFLPTQMAWAVAGAYCGHEHGQAAHHFGHHDHVHTSSGPDQPSPGKLDTDCGYHNHSGFQGIPIEISAFVIPAKNGAQNAVDPFLHPEPVVQRPDRPKWPAAV